MSSTTALSDLDQWIFSVHAVYCRKGNFCDRKFSQFWPTGNSCAGNFRKWACNGTRVKKNWK